MRRLLLIVIISASLLILIIGIILAIVLSPEPNHYTVTILGDHVYNQPVYLTWSTADDPNDRIVYVVEEEGTIQRVSDNGHTVREFANHRDIVNSNGFEQGLLCVAFPYTASGFYVIMYTNEYDDVVVARVASGNVETVCSVSNPSLIHNGGWIGFSETEDDILFIAIGDTMKPESAQDLSVLSGKLLKVVVTKTVIGIPPDNPYIETPGALHQIYATGLRDPWRCSVDPHGRVWIGDVGFVEREEVNLVEQPGEDFGWPDSTKENAKEPQYSYPHIKRMGAVVGGHVYRGSMKDRLFEGRYVFGDFCSGCVYTVDGKNNRDMVVQLGAVSAIGEDATGALYALDYQSGRVHVICM